MDITPEEKRHLLAKATARARAAGRRAVTVTEYDCDAANAYLWYNDGKHERLVTVRRQRSFVDDHREEKFDRPVVRYNVQRTGHRLPGMAV